MDDTQHSRVSDAGATRKRRSSILKSQRPARKPFSELEFNVATPTDTAKSRRVSFSKRTGVAEFVTNEATTTWKNFYEEHNKSLESSGNDSGANASRQPIGHLGKRIFEQQFEEVEALDFITSLDNLAPRNINTSLNVNFTEQLASLECTDDKKLTAPQNNFELSAFTDHHSKLFSDDLAIPVMGEMSGQIDVNFSAMQPLDVKDDLEKDDLDEIQRDLQRRSNVVGPTPFRDARDFPEYIEVELNSTHAANKNEESDMSITETIRSPKVNVSKTLTPDQKFSLNWVGDEENNCLDDIKAKTLIFDNNADMSITTALPSKVHQNPEKDNIAEKRKTILFEDHLGDLSMTKPIPAKMLSIHCKSEEKTNLNDISHKSSVQIIVDKAEKRRTILFEDDLGNLSMTKPISAKLLSVHSEIIDKSILNEHANRPSLQTIKYDTEKRKTILFEDNLGDLSITKPIPAKIMSTHSESAKIPDLNENDSRFSVKTIEDGREICRTILFKDDLENLSMTKPIPAKLLSIHKEIEEKTDLNENSNKTSVESIENRTEKRRTILFEDDLGDLSMTKPIPAKLLSVHSDIIDKSILNEHSNKSSLQTMKCESEKQKPILFKDDFQDLSMTKPISSKLLSLHTLHKSHLNDSKNLQGQTENFNTDRRQTILFDDGDLSITKPIPAKLLSIHSEIIDKSNMNDNFDSHEPCILEHNDNKFQAGYDRDEKITDMLEKRKTIFDEGDLSITKPIQTKLLSDYSALINKSVTNDNLNKPNLNKSQTIVRDNEENNADMSITTEIHKSMNNSMRKTQLVDDSLGNMSMTKPIPAKLLSVHSEIINHTRELLDINHSINVADKRNDVTISKPISNNLFNLQSVESKTEFVSLDFSNFKSQDVVVYQVTTNEPTKEQRDCSELQDYDKHGDVMTVQPSDDENKYLMMVDMNEDPVKEEKHLKEESEKVNKISENREEIKDISSNVSIYSVVGNDPPLRTISKKSILDNLLDMSNASMISGFDDKNITANITSNKPSTQEMLKADAESVTSEMFYITRDTDSETQSSEIKNKKTYPIIKFVEDTKEHVSQELLRSDSVSQTDNNSTQKVICELKDSNEVVVNSSNKRHFEKVASTDTTTDVSVDFDHNYMDISRYPKSFSEVDNTKQLLDMLSDLTDGRKSISGEDSPLPTTVKDKIAIENKEINEPRRVSIAPNRQSIALNREDLLSNISMAQAALQRSIDMEDSDVEEPTPAVSISPPKKTVRVSNEVVKTLHFEDESASEVSVKSEQRSPLRKTAFGETSYMGGGFKANVIPSYLKDVSDGIKSLMNDLVKPMSDEMPYDAVCLGKNVKRSNSTCSTQIQANLYTSSQIDMNNELYSNSNSNNMYHVEQDNRDGNNITLSPKSPMKSVSFIGSDVSAHSELVSRNLKEASFRPRILSPDQSIPGKVLVFDHENPLNNVLLTPTEFTEVHKYCPAGESQETLEGSDESHSTQCSVRGSEYGVANVAVRYNIENINTGCQSGDTNTEIISNHQSVTSNISKPLSVDQSIDVKVTELKDTEVNTAIVMKKNKELLETSSSLTLVDDALARSTFDVDIDSVPTESLSNISNSKNKAPLKVIYKLKRDVTKEKIDSDLTSNDEADTVKALKRIYSVDSSEKCKNLSPSKKNVTPKPLAKMQRLSDSPNNRSYSLKRISGNKSLIAERDFSSAESKMDMSPSKESPRKRSPKKKNSPKKEGVSITVQQLLTEFNVKPEIDQTVLNKQILEALSGTDSSAAPDSVSECERSVELVSSFTSSKNQCKARPSVTASEVETNSDSLEEWGVEGPMKQCDSSVNVVAKIDMLPFMGSHECEWAPSGTDSWCFHLLHGRLRLAIRLAHRHHNATRTWVRADTPVLDVGVHQSHRGNDQKNSVAMSCITFACLAIRQQAVGVARAGAVPGLLRRGAGVARRALRWGRAMHHARMHLAYTLSEDHTLVLKVANIPLRCVWEASMRLSLSDPSRPWPRASDVRVTRVLDGRAAHDARLGALLDTVRDDWGHVPVTVWTLFKYLKNKTSESEELGL